MFGILREYVQCSRPFGLVAVWLCLISAAGADIAPRSGTFEGVYHQDRWGVGHFNYYFVHPDLHAKLNAFRGRRLRVVVTRAEQLLNPGPAIIVEMGKITTIDESPLKIDVSTIPAHPAPSQPFQLVCQLRNNGKQPLLVKNHYVTIGIRSARSIDRPEEPSFLLKGYSQGQLAVEEQRVQMRHSLVNLSDGGYTNLVSVGHLIVAAGESFPLVVLFPRGLGAGKHEISASAIAQFKNRKELLPISVMWQPLDITENNAAVVERAKPALKLVRKSIARSDENYRFSAIVTNPGTPLRRIVQIGGGDYRRFSGRLQAFDKQGTEIPLHVEQDFQQTGRPAQLREISPKGVPFAISFRKKSRFAPAGIASLKLDLLTDDGVQSFSLFEQFYDEYVAPATPFGPTIDHVKLRIRPTRHAFNSGDPIRFYFQAVNTTGIPVNWRVPSGGLGRNVIVEIDGKPIEQPDREAEYVGGWSADWTCKFPREKTIALPAHVQPGPGVHTIRYSIVSQKGTYENSNGRPIPLVNGRLVSNESSFAIE